VEKAEALRKEISMKYPRLINDKKAHLAWLKTQEYKDLLQKDRILKYIDMYGSITPGEAIAELGIMRLGARVFELIEEGWPVINDTATGVNRFGDVTRYANYRLAA
jgi:hypothetical protein